MITKTIYAAYKNVPQEQISTIEHFIKWGIGGNGFDNTLKIMEKIDELFPSDVFIVIPTIDSSEQIPTKKVFVQKI